MTISYSFKLPQRQPVEQLYEYSTNDFLLDLPAHWKETQSTTDNTVNFTSNVHDAALIISADFFEIPDSKAHLVADKCLNSRIDALEQLSPSQVNVVRRTISPHSGGGGLELSLAVETPQHVHIYLGYVTSRKILNLTLIAKPDKYAAAELFNKIVASYQPKLP